uniref:Uncharacterized protein n=1 Tax=viral metagenome TaxID=1070528 RepID=A0A6M3IH39_9ZZZZ
MSWVAVAIAAAAVVGAAASTYSASKSSKAAKEATQAQVAGADAATQAELKMYYQSREDLAPWREVGEGALKDVNKVISAPPTEAEFAESPSYNFLFDQGIEAVKRSASATGQLGGGLVKKATKFGQGLASTGYSNFLTDWLRTQVNPKLALANVGQVATGQGVNAAINTGTNVAQNYLTAGNARASGYINQANAVTGGVQGVGNAVNQGVNNYLFYDYLKNRDRDPAVDYGTLGG